VIPETGTIELLTSIRIGQVWHAIYPTADLTLCGLAAVLLAPGRRQPPTCGRCSVQSRRFDRIDKSMPERWRTA
jgi:hypothetical protein